MATCNVTFKIKDAGENAINGALVMARYKTPQGTAGDTIVASRGWVTATTDANGDATLALTQESAVRVVCAESGLDAELTVPALSSYDFANEP